MFQDFRLTFLKQWIANTAKPAKGLLVPVSGGTDSALTFYLLSQVYPQKTLGIFIGENLRAKEWFCKIGSMMFPLVPSDWKYPEVERNAMFQKVASSEGRWLTGTRNRTEHVFGTFSLASRVATYLPIVGLWKTEVIELCNIIGVPEEVITSSRRADPDCGRPPELAEIPLENIDIFLKVKESCLDSSYLTLLTVEQIQYLDKLYEENLFKIHLPVMGPSIP